MAPDTPHSLSSSWLVSKVFCRDFSITQRKDIKKNNKNKIPENTNTRKNPKATWCRPLEHLWCRPLRKSSSASGRSPRSGRRGPGSAGPRSCPLGWAQVRAAGGKNCVSGHPVGSSAGDCDHWAQGPGPGALHWSPLERNQQPCSGGSA